MSLLYGSLYHTWMSRAAPTAVTARLVRTVLRYLAVAVGADDWSALPTLPEQHAIVLLNGALAQTTLRSQSRSNYRNYLRGFYRFAKKEGLDVNGNNTRMLWPPAPNHGTVPRRARAVYARFTTWAIGCGIWPDTLQPKHLLDWALSEKARSNGHWRRDFDRLQSVCCELEEVGALCLIAFPSLPAPLSSKYRVDVERWPEHLVQEWQRISRSAMAPLRSGGMRPWREKTRKRYQGVLCRFLGWAAKEHPERDLSTETWASLLTAENCRELINWLVARSGKDSVNHAHTAMLRAIRGLHRFELGSSREVVQSFTDLCRRCEVEERDKAVRMAPFPVVEQGYRKLLDKVTAAMKCNDRKLSEAALAKLQADAIILGLLTTRALRRFNIVNIRLGRSLVQNGDGYTLRYAAAEMKGHRRFDVTVPAELVPVITDYLHRGYRALAGRMPADGDLLLLTSRGTPVGEDGFGARVGSLTQKYVGKRLYPHLYRHILATHAAQVWRMTPTELAAFLGHRNVLTVMRYYEITSPARAAERFDAFRNGAA